MDETKKIYNSITEMYLLQSLSFIFNRCVRLSLLFSSVEAESCAQKTKGSKCCVFPFIYQGHSYSSCVAGGLSSTHWCATTEDYDRDGQWDYCEGVQ